MQTINMATVRTTLVCSSFLLTFIILAWMMSEQEKVKICTEMHSVKRVVYQTENKSWDHNWDMWQFLFCRKASGNSVDSIATRTMVLVRHGQYDLMTGRLTAMGERQANLTGYRLRQMYPEYDVIIHSSLERAVQTAGHLHRHLPMLSMVQDDFIREGGPIPPNPPISYWNLPDRMYFEDGPRIEAAFRKHFYREDNPQAKKTRQILVGHGNIFRYFILRVLQFPRDGWMRFFIAHASITVIHINADGSVAVDKLGDCGHLPVDMVTY